MRWLGRSRVPTVPRPLGLLGAGAIELGAHLRGRERSVSRSSLTFVSRSAGFPNRRAREELGWAPQVRLADGMARTEVWLRATGRL